MTTSPEQIHLFCAQCGAKLRADARFCEQCGASVPDVAPPAKARKSDRGETVIGHVPLDLQAAGKGLFGRIKTRQCELLITDRRLLFLMEDTWAGDERWLQEQFHLDFEALIDNEKFEQWRQVMDEYDFAKALWADLYDTPPDKLLEGRRESFALDVDAVVSADVTLEGEWDTLDLLLSDGDKHHAMIFLMLGRVAARFLTAALGSERVNVYP